MNTDGGGKDGKEPSPLNIINQGRDKEKTDMNDTTPATKHTPGPWTIEDNQILAAGVFVVATVSDIEDFPCMDEEENPGAYEQASRECEANALLIAAAPDMYAALKMVEPYARDVIKKFESEKLESYRARNEQVYTEAKAIIAAIAKAEGNSPEAERPEFPDGEFPNGQRWQGGAE